MNKFIEAIEIYLDPERIVKPEMPKVLMEPISIYEDFARVNHLDRYLLRLQWGTHIWLNPPVLDSVLEQAKKEAISNFKGFLYLDIHRALSEIRYLIKYNKQEEALEEIQNLMVEIMS